MKITFLGHAGFYIETSKSIIIMDPWVSENGAFDGGWFQYPRNHHMSDFIKNRLIENNALKEVFIYVSHEHKDHFDVPFLKDLEKFEFKYIIPSFRRTLLADQIKAFSKKEVILCKDQTYVNINLEERVKIFTDDSELNRDSAILFMSGGKKFLNMNDCKIHDRLGSIKKTEGKIDVLALQFSGATWHPTCYEYTDKEYTRISKKKKLSKFEATALAIENLEPSAYIPSAGPACFLDPDIIHLNFQEHNIFPRDSQVVDYLNRRLRRFKPQICQMMPGDKLNINHAITLVEGSEKKITDEDFREYINQYAKDYEDFFYELKKEITDERFDELLRFLIREFQDKLNNFKSRKKISRPLFFEFIDRPNTILEINFEKGEVAKVSNTPEDNFYRLKVYSYDIQRIKEGFLTWEDYSLTFRMRLNREPDVYQVLMQGFLILEKEDLNFFCDKILELKIEAKE